MILRRNSGSSFSASDTSLPTYSRGIVDPGFAYRDSLNIPPILNGGRRRWPVILNHLADIVGPLNMMIPTCVIAGIAMFSWISVHKPG